MGKLPAFRLTTDELMRQTVRDGMHILPIGDHHIAAYDQIPLYADHRGPFDRLILATALVEKMPVISADGHFHRYNDVVEIIW
ncbi:PIN domain-containing protein [Fibrella forsythiae]|uniref:PIN domain-containing protein n=1 Tax=Fibrella forsythiae TaxID=2817061 RepID=UPI00286E5134|nr:PIN domain-containing protein [Fibrella forsythiae]